MIDVEDDPPRLPAFCRGKGRKTLGGGSLLLLS